MEDTYRDSLIAIIILLVVLVGLMIGIVYLAATGDEREEYLHTAQPEQESTGLELCFTFPDPLISHSSTGHYGDRNSYICNNGEQYYFCQPTYVECK